VTVAVAVKVFDGIVLAADSATTVTLPGGGHQVWNNANKVFHLHRKYPVAAMTWGLGNIGSASIATLAKDLRRRFMGGDVLLPDWKLQETYTVEEVANLLVSMIFDELYAPEFSGPQAPYLGMLVAGYSATSKQAEAWLIEMTDPAMRPVPTLLMSQDRSGWHAFGQYDAAVRLLKGYDLSLPDRLAAVLDPAEAVKAEQLLTSGVLECPAVASAMPFADAIAFAKFLVDTTVGYSRFRFGPDTVGGPVEVAGITRHEGFKWISRKHYYGQDLNPEDPHHDSY
jgi:hypothetical protein